MTPEARPLRVLWVIKGLGPGGAERLLLTLAEVSDDKEVDYSVAYRVPEKSQLVPELKAVGVPATLLDDGRGRPLGWVFALRRLIARGSVDIVHTHSPVMAVVVRLILRTLPPSRRPLSVYTEHNHWRAYSPLTRYANAVTHAADDHTFAVSHAVLDSIRPTRRRRATEVLVHGINRESLNTRRDKAEVRQELGMDEHQCLIITVANMRSQKAYPDLISAAKTVLAETDNVHFFAVGQGPLLESTQAEVRRCGIDERFHLLGQRDDVFELLGAADIFALASVWEGFPIAIMEAMSMGLPCVATRVGGVPDAIDDGVEGLLVPPRDPVQLAAALLDMLSDESRRHRMSEAARARSMSFDIRGTNTHLIETYRSLAAGRVRTRPGAETPVES